MTMIMLMVVIVLTSNFAVFDIVMMKTKKSFDKKHNHEPEKDPDDDLPVSLVGGNR